MLNNTTYIYKEGLYSLEDMIILVKYKNITPQDFYKTTKISYEDAIKTIKRGDTN